MRDRLVLRISSSVFPENMPPVTTLIFPKGFFMAGSLPSIHCRRRGHGRRGIEPVVVVIELLAHGRSDRPLATLLLLIFFVGKLFRGWGLGWGPIREFHAVKSESASVLIGRSRHQTARPCLMSCSLMTSSRFS